MELRQFAPLLFLETPAQFACAAFLPGVCVEKNTMISPVRDANTGRVPEAGPLVARVHAGVLRLAGLLNYDFCPWANRWVYWLKHPLAFLGLAAVGSLSCGLFLNSQAFIAVAVLLTVVLIGVLWPAVALRGLDSRLEFAGSRVSEGSPATVRLIVRNRFPFPVWGLSIVGGLRQGAQLAALAHVSGWSEAEFVLSVVPELRGVYPIGSPQLQTGFPFGLWRATRNVQVSGQLIVWPQSVSLDALPDVTSDSRSEEQLTDRRAGDLGDMTGTRHFRQGDSLRRIHWAQSARHQRFIVTERQSGADSRVRLTVDLDTRNHTGAGRNASLEWTLRIAAGICDLLVRHHVVVDCQLGAERFVLRDSRDLRRLLDGMARVPEAGYSHLKKSPCRNRAAMAAEFVCTTDLGLPEQRSSRQARRFITLATDGFAGRSSDSKSCVTDLPACVTRPWLSITSPEEAEASMARHWRRACRVA